MDGPPDHAASNGPPEGQTYCLHWNNHKSNLVEVLDCLIKMERYVDCTIVVDDQVKFKAHRVILAANSPYFQSILQDLPMDNCIIIFPGVKEYEMRALLQYMYTGQVNVTESEMARIYPIAVALAVKGLFDMNDLKEKFNKSSAERSYDNPYASTTVLSNQYSSVNGTSSPSAGITNTNGSFIESDNCPNYSSPVISTSSYISPSAAATNSSSPSFSNYKSPYTSLYTKSPGPTTSQPNSAIQAQSNQHTTTSNLTPASESSAAAPQWPISPSAAAAAAMLSSVYESATDMNPLKRKKLSSMSSMLMNRDTPILRNVLAQTNLADSSQPLPLILPNTSGNSNNDKSSSLANGGNHSNNPSSNGSEFSDRNSHDESHSPSTDRSLDDDSFDHRGGNSAVNVPSSSNPKPEWKRYKQYTRADILAAIECVRKGMSALQASRKFNVPSRTLYDKVKKLGITTGRPMNRTTKRSSSNIESSAAFPYAHGYGQTSAASAAIHDAAAREERELNEHQRHRENHHLPSAIPHPAAALLDHAFLHQALEAHGGGNVAGREALHAMALAAAAHAAANRLSTSPGPSGNAVLPPSPTNFALKYANLRNADHKFLERQELERGRDFMGHEHERDLKHERELENGEREEEEDQVEDLSVARKDHNSTPTDQRSVSPISTSAHNQDETEQTVIMSTKLPSNTNNHDNSPTFLNEPTMKRELVIDDIRAE